MENNLVVPRDPLLRNTITDNFGVNLAKILAKKIINVYPKFNAKEYVAQVKKHCRDLSYTERVALHAEALKLCLPSNYKKAAQILGDILGPENPNETGMFREFYWLLPVGKFIEVYGIADFTTSIRLIEELTKRNTGEYAIRPFIRKYPKKSLSIIKRWAKSKNFHVRRLASEGLRPKLPWATKLDLFIDTPDPVFAILELLKADPIRFVQKSVANNVRDYTKVNPVATKHLLLQWSKSKDPHTRWIVKHATR
jgi:3-methyladenine DNA glycosylase AlkC